MKRFLVNLPDALHQDLRNLSRARGQTLNGLIREILWDWVRANVQGQTQDSA